MFKHPTYQETEHWDLENHALNKNIAKNVITKNMSFSCSHLENNNQGGDFG